MKQNRKQAFVYIGMTVVAIIIGFSFIFVKIALRHTNTFDVLTYRFASASIALILLAGTGVVKFPKLSLQKLWPLFLLSLFYPILFFGLQTIGLVYSSASEAGIIFALTPIVTLIFAYFFLKERTSLMQKLGVAASVSGVIYIFYNKGLESTEGNLLGNLFLTLSVISIVGYYVIGKKLTTSYSAMDLTVIIVFLAFFVFSGMSVYIHLQNESWLSFIKVLENHQFMIAILYLGLLSTLLTAFITNYALSIVPASIVSVFNNLSPIIAVFGGVVVLGDQLYHYHILGGALVFLGVFTTLFFKKR